MAALRLLNLPTVGVRGTNLKGYLLCRLLLFSHVSCPSGLACTLKPQAASRLKAGLIATNPIVWLPGPCVHGSWR